MQVEGGQSNGVGEGSEYLSGRGGGGGGGGTGGGGGGGGGGGKYLERGGKFRVGSQEGLEHLSERWQVKGPPQMESYQNSTEYQ